MSAVSTISWVSDTKFIQRQRLLTVCGIPVAEGISQLAEEDLGISDAIVFRDGNTAEIVERYFGSVKQFRLDHGFPDGRVNQPKIAALMLLSLLNEPPSTLFAANSNITSAKIKTAINDSAYIEIAARNIALEVMLKVLEIPRGTLPSDVEERLLISFGARPLSDAGILSEYTLLLRSSFGTVNAMDDTPEGEL